MPGGRPAEHAPKWITWSMFEHSVKCIRCGWVPEKGPFRTEQMAQDAWAKHRAAVDRVKNNLALRKGDPTLTATARYYRSQADNVELSEDERALWEQLAVEVERRLGHAPTPEEEPELPLGL